MKTLYMVRHAKSSWENNVDDHRRPLNSRGKKDAKLVSTVLSTILPPPQKIISSDATRAFTTAEFFKEAFKVADEDFITTHDLYDFSGPAVMKIIRGIVDALDLVMIVGHNHAFTSLANMMGNKFIENVPTSGFVMIQFDTQKWNEINNGETVKTLFLRDLKND